MVFGSTLLQFYSPVVVHPRFYGLVVPLSCGATPANLATLVGMAVEQ